MDTAWPLHPAGSSAQSWVHRSGEQEKGRVGGGLAHTPPGPPHPQTAHIGQSTATQTYPWCSLDPEQGEQSGRLTPPSVLLGCPEPSQDSPQPGKPSHPPFGGAAGLHGGEGPGTPGPQQPQEHPRLCLAHRKACSPLPGPGAGDGEGGWRARRHVMGPGVGNQGLPEALGRECGRRTDGGAEARIPRPQGGVGPRAEAVEGLAFV